ncbi:AzlD domain-containing protein, partial [Accumulibacter sp.]
MIIGIGVATFLIRFAPIALLSRLELPAALRQALR